MYWLKSTFGVDKPIIAMCHLQAMPGDPGYDADGGMAKVIDLALADLNALQNGGVDAVMFSNEFSLPYLTRVKPETIAAMGRVIGELMRFIKVPFGVNVLWDPIASIDLAAATGALFIREIIKAASMPAISVSGTPTSARPFGTRPASLPTCVCSITSSPKLRAILAIAPSLTLPGQLYSTTGPTLSASPA